MLIRIFVLCSFLFVIGANIQAHADGRKSFDTSQVPGQENKARNRVPVQEQRPVHNSSQNNSAEQEEQSSNEPAINIPAEILKRHNRGSGMKSRIIPTPDNVRKEREVTNVPSRTGDRHKDTGEYVDEEEIASEDDKETGEIWDNYEKISNSSKQDSSMKSRVDMSEDEKSEAEKEAEEKEARKAEQNNALRRALSDYRDDKDAKNISRRSYGKLNN
tara:strand:- start:381 stop:1031 length:651 start_codon:yes stop_codon:yes gene_type:complete